MADTDAPGPDTAETPLLRIVRGNPDEAEVAALTAVVAGLAAGPAGAPRGVRGRSRWADPASRLRVPERPGRDGWRASAYPA